MDVPCCTRHCTLPLRPNGLRAVVPDLGGHALALTYHSLEAQLHSLKEGVLGLTVQLVHAVCFVPLATGPGTVALCFAALESPQARRAMTPEQYAEASRHPCTVVLAFEVLAGQWQQSSVSIEHPTEASPAPCVLPCGVDLLHVAATFDRCAALALGRVHVWAVRPAGEASVALSPLLSLDVGSADVPRVPPVVGGGPVCLLLTPAFLCLGGCGAVDAAGLPPAGGAGEAAPAPGPGDGAWHSVRFADKGAGHRVQELRAVDSSRIIALTTGNVLFLLHIYHPYRADVCIRLETPQRVKMFDVAPAYLKLLSPMGAAALCYVDLRGNLHFAGLTAMLDTLALRYHRRAAAGDGTAGLPGGDERAWAVAPARSVFHPQRLAALAMVGPHLLVVATPQALQGFTLEYAAPSDGR